MAENEEVSSEAHPDPSRWWTWRRKGMITALRWLIIQSFGWGVLAYLSPEAMEAISAVAIASYIATCIPIVGYYSNTALDDYVKKMPGG